MYNENDVKAKYQDVREPSPFPLFVVPLLNRLRQFLSIAQVNMSTWKHDRTNWAVKVGGYSAFLPMTVITQNQNENVHKKMVTKQGYGGGLNFLVGSVACIFSDLFIVQLYLYRVPLKQNLLYNTFFLAISVSLNA